MTVLHHILYLTAASALFASGSIPALTAPPIERVSLNDNTRAAGTVDGDVVTVRLRAATGSWRPEGEAGPSPPHRGFRWRARRWPFRRRAAAGRRGHHPRRLGAELGDGLRDEPIAGVEGRRVVTQMVPGGGTLTMTWVPERAGNWLFHCHVMAHVAPERRLGVSPSGGPARGYLGDSGLSAAGTGGGEHDRHADQAGAAHASHAAHAGHGRHGAPAVHDPNDPSLGMAGMVLGITVRERENAPAPAPAPAAPANRGAAPGPPVVLRRGEPVAITLVNRLDESTSMHSSTASSWTATTSAGVHGWSGLGPKVAPMLVPGHAHRPHHAAADRHVHLPHAPARLPAAVVRPLRTG